MGLAKQLGSVSQACKAMGYSRKQLYRSVAKLQTDLDLWLAKYNEQRPHPGKYCYAKTPKAFRDQAETHLISKRFMQTFRETLHIAVEKTIRASDPADAHNPILSATS